MDGGQQEAGLRRLEVHWNRGLIAASIAVSLLGAFTSTQMMCQARTARYLSGVLVWTILGSLTFGFCSIWSLHFIAMLACELPLVIGLDVPLTVLSAFLAVTFTFLALASDIMRERYLRLVRRRRLMAKRQSKKDLVRAPNGTTDPLLGPRTSEGEYEYLNVPGVSNVSADNAHTTRESGASMTLGPLEDHFSSGERPGIAAPDRDLSPDLPDTSPHSAWRWPLLTRNGSFLEE